jgi:hypothetical protein
VTSVIDERHGNASVSTSWMALYPGCASSEDFTTFSQKLHSSDSYPRTDPPKHTYRASDRDCSGSIMPQKRKHSLSAAPPMRPPGLGATIQASPTEYLEEGTLPLQAYALSSNSPRSQDGIPNQAAIKRCQSDSGGSEATSEPTTKVRKRAIPVKSACLSCQKRKTKCSGERPICRFCSTRGHTCKYDVTDGLTRTAQLKQELEQASNDRDRLTQELRDQKEVIDQMQLQIETSNKHGRWEGFVDSMRSGTDKHSTMLLARLRTGASVQDLTGAFPSVIKCEDDGKVSIQHKGDIATTVSIDDVAAYSPSISVNASRRESGSDRGSTLAQDLTSPPYSFANAKHLTRENSHEQTMGLASPANSHASPQTSFLVLPCNSMQWDPGNTLASSTPYMQSFSTASFGSAGLATDQMYYHPNTIDGSSTFQAQMLFPASQNFASFDDLSTMQLANEAADIQPADMQHPFPETYHPYTSHASSGAQTDLPGAYTTTQSYLSRPSQLYHHHRTSRHQSRVSDSKPARSENTKYAAGYASFLNGDAVLPAARRLPIRTVS